MVYSNFPSSTWQQPRCWSTRAENVEELADAFGLRGTGHGIGPHKGHPHKPGLRAQIAGQTQRTHAPAVALQGQIAREMILGLLAGQVHEIVQIHHLRREGRIVGHHPRRGCHKPSSPP